MSVKNLFIAGLLATMATFVGTHIYYFGGDFIETYRQPTVLAFYIIACILLINILVLWRGQEIRQYENKLQNYIKLVDYFSDIYLGNNQNGVRHTRMLIQLWLVGSQKVVTIAQAIPEISDPNKKLETLEDLLNEIRQEVGIGSLGKNTHLISNTSLLEKSTNRNI